MNITTEMKDLEQSKYINHFFTFNSKVSSILDNYLFNEEITKSGLTRKREPENIIETKNIKRGYRV